MSEGWSWSRSLFRGGSDSQTFFLPGCETFKDRKRKIENGCTKGREMPQAIGIGIHMLKNRVASQVWQERADKLTRQGVSQQCRAIKIFSMSVQGGI